jgi:hypothetical protein
VRPQVHPLVRFIGSLTFYATICKDWSRYWIPTGTPNQTETKHNTWPRMNQISRRSRYDKRGKGWEVRRAHRCLRWEIGIGSQQECQITRKQNITLRDMGTHGSPPTRVPEVPVKWTWPAGSTFDLQVDPETLSVTSTTLEDNRRPYPDPGGSAGLGAQGELPDHGLPPPVSLWIAGYSL